MRTRESESAGKNTDRRRTADALAQSERQLRVLAEELADERAHLVAAQSVAKLGSWSTELRGMAVTWSAETHRMFGTDPATFAPTYERFLARVHPEDRTAVDRAFLASFESRTTHNIAHRITTITGDVKFVEEAWRVTHGDDGTPLRAVGTIQDVSERREAEERVRAADARLRAVLNNAPVIIVAVDPQGTFTLSEGRGLEAAGLAPGQIVGQSVADLFAHIDVVQADGVTLSVSEAVHRVLAGDSVSGLAKMGSEYFDNDFVPDRDADGRVVGMIGVASVVTARHLAELRVQHLSRVHAMLSGINETIVREHQSGTMLESACRLAVERGQFAMAWIALAAETGTLVLTAHAGAHADTVQEMRTLLGSAGLGPGCAFTARALSSGESVICHDMASDPLALPWRNVAHGRSYGSMASLPLKVRGAVIGTFNLYATEPSAFDAEEMRLLNQLARDIAFGLELHEREHERGRIDAALRDSETSLRRSMADLQAVSARLNQAREQERVKMARDIHDHLGQALTVLKMDVAEVRRRLDAGDNAMVGERLTQMSSLLDTSMEDVRRVAAELRPVVLDDLGFVAAIRAYLIDIERRAHVRCAFHTALTDLAIADDRATALFRILQEALTNVIRHADARRVDVRLTVEAGVVRLAVHDDGRGITAAAAGNPRALGIVGMGDRARLFGGDVAVFGGPDEGTTVTVELPLAEGAP